MSLSDLPPWAAALLDEVPVGHLGLLDEHTHPRVQPVTFVRLDDALWSAVDDKPKRRPGAELARVRRLRERPQAALTVDRYDDDWTRLAWVQVLGRVAIVESDARALAALARRYPPYRDAPPRGPLLRLDPARVLWWRATPPTSAPC
ncbi:MAG TPA: pyridoxamine 5'-phosphate oxidase family protein [Solirubrobacter sp.]|nr:pyridoxamine 5'-phosphate oxidase family protein [Solirubrobacter sp.]